jgi:hypothetical protein
MRKLFLLACLSATTLLSCKKEDKTPKQPCEILNSGDLNVLNYTVDDFQVYIDGKLSATSHSGSLQKLTLDAGYHSIQVINYSNTSDVRTNSIDIIQCGTLKYDIN